MTNKLKQAWCETADAHLTAFALPSFYAYVRTYVHIARLLVCPNGFARTYVHTYTQTCLLVRPRRERKKRENEKDCFWSLTLKCSETTVATQL